jgi:hypothetical protein
MNTIKYNEELSFNVYIVCNTLDKRIFLIKILILMNIILENINKITDILYIVFILFLDYKKL